MLSTGSAAACGPPSLPAPSQSRMKFEPMKPAPPVTKIMGQGMGGSKGGLSRSGVASPVRSVMLRTGGSLAKPGGKRIGRIRGRPRA